jgi:hypothetical protein
LEGLIMRSVSILLLAAASLGSAWPAFAQPAAAPKDKPPAKAAAPAAPEQPLPTLNIVVSQRDRDAAYTYYRDEIAAGRCPPPLVRKNNACAAPAAGKQVWKLDQPLPEGVTGEPLPAALIGKLSSSRAGYQYLRIDNDILIVGVGTRSVAALVADLSRL